MIGITTAPRTTPTLKTTVQSLINSGISREKIITFIDGAADHEGLDVQKILRPSRLGAWKNWYESLKWLYENTDGKWLYLFQDDVIFSRGWKEYFERSKVPGNAAICSIFSPAKYPTTYKGWYSVEDISLWMSQTCIIRRSAAKEILESRVVWSVRGDRQIDNRLGLWLYQSDRKIYFHSPSLAEHIGEASTLWENAKIEGWRKSIDFKGETYDCGHLHV